MQINIFDLGGGKPLVSSNVEFTSAATSADIVDAPSGGKRIVPVWAYVNVDGGSGLTHVYFSLFAKSPSDDQYIVRRLSGSDILYPQFLNFRWFAFNSLPAETALRATVGVTSTIKGYVRVGYYLI